MINAIKTPFYGQILREVAIPFIFYLMYFLVVVLMQMLTGKTFGLELNMLYCVWVTNCILQNIYVFLLSALCAFKSPMQ